MKKIGCFLIILVLVSACSSRQYRSVHNVNSNIEQELRWADDIARLYQSLNYQEIAYRLEGKLAQTEQGNISRRYIALELAELYAYKLIDYDKAKKYIQLTEESPRFGVSSYINLPRNTRDYNAEFYENYFLKFRNINSEQVNDRIVLVKNSVDHLMSQSSQSTDVPEDDKQQLTKAIEEFKAYLDEDLNYQQRIKILARLSLFNFRLGKEKNGSYYFSQLSNLINDNPFKHNNLEGVLKPINQVELAYSLGNANLKTKHYLMAKDNFNAAIQIYEVFRNSIHSESQRIDVFANLDVLYSKLISNLFILNDTAGVISAIERTKARTLVERLNSKQYLSVNQQKNVQKIQDFTQQALNADSNELRGIRGLVRQSIQQQDNIESVASTPFVEVNTSDLFPDRAKNRAVLLFYTTDDYFISALISPKEITTRYHELKPKQIEKLVEQLYYQRDGSVLFKPEQVVLQALEDLLFSDYKNNLQGINELVIIPHGILHSLPFDALFDGRKYLVESYAISYAPSLSLYKNFLARKYTGKSKNIWAYGNPVYPLEANNLPGAAREVQEIIRKIGVGHHLLGAQASEKHLRDHASKADVIHLSTHGKFDAIQPMNSFVLLTSDKDSAGTSNSVSGKDSSNNRGLGRQSIQQQGNDGFILASDFFKLPLNNTRLFVLSACETSIEQIKNGDDMFGFTRSLSYAGAGSILSPLWAVDDAATTYLMSAFYGYLAQNKTVTEALRLSKLDTLRKYRDPSYWAAFKLIGNPLIKI